MGSPKSAPQPMWTKLCSLGATTSFMVEDTKVLISSTMKSSPKLSVKHCFSTVALSRAEVEPARM